MAAARRADALGSAEIGAGEKGGKTG